MAAIRRQWLQTVVRELQVNAASDGGTWARAVHVEQLLIRLPPASPVERLIIDGLRFQALRGAIPMLQGGTVSGERPGGIPEHVLTCRRLLEVRFRQGLRLSSVAREIGVAPRILTRHFREHTGMTFREYLARVRVRAAVDLLLHSDYKTELIHDEVGYRARSAFYREFKRLTRTTPASFRTQARAARGLSKRTNRT